MVAVLLLLQCVVAFVASTAASAVSFQKGPRSLAISGAKGAGSSPADIAVFAFLCVTAIEQPPRISAGFSTPFLWSLPPKVFHLGGSSNGTHLFACRPRPKKEKALRNYRIAKQQKQRREERVSQRCQQLEVLKAREQLLSVSETNGSYKTVETTAQSSLSDSLFGTYGSPTAADGETADVPSVLRGHLSARINYRLVGGTWRRARKAGRFVRIPGAQLAAAVFEGLPEEEVAQAIAKAKRQDAGQMDLEAYDESDTQLATLEGLS